MQLHETLFHTGLYLSYLLYLIAYFQIGYYDPKYLDMLELAMKYYVIFFLLIRFNPFTSSTFTDFDRKVVFSSAMFLLATTTFTEYAKNSGIGEFAKKIGFLR